MANDPVADEPAAELSEPVGDWLRTIATEQGVPEEELLRRLLDGADDRVDETTVDRRLDALESSLRGRLEELDDDFQAKIEDVRERVIQVKRETDAKAPADHGHGEFEELDRRIEDLDGSLDAVELALDDAVDRFEHGFENYEEILEYLTDATDDLDRKLDALAAVVVDLRDGFEALEEERGRRRVLDRLTAKANRHGVRRAQCDACDNRVDLGLLTEPRCPHCEEPFVDLDPSRRFLGTSRLETGTPPALEGDVAGDEDGFEAGADRTDADHGDVEPSAAAGEPAESGWDSDAPAGGREPAPERDWAAGAEKLTSIRGIGPEYADRLSGAGVGSVDDLAAVDPEALADETGISVARIERWIDRAEAADGR